MRRLSLLLMACNVFVGCDDLARPNTLITVVNVPAMHRIGYNLLTDYYINGNLLPTAKPTVIPFAQLLDLNKLICTDAQGWANLKAYVRNERARTGE